MRHKAVMYVMRTSTRIALMSLKFLRCKLRVRMPGNLLGMLEDVMKLK